MLPGMNPRKMQQMMRRMGIQQSEVDATEVIIRTADKEYVFSQPSVSKVNMMGQDTWQIVGEAEERSLETAPDINEDDVATVVGQTGVSEEEARAAIEANEGDLAATILGLQQKKG